MRRCRAALALACAALLARAANSALPSCRLAIVAAGAPRTGSTQQQRLIQLALQELGVADAVVNAGYWNWPAHANLGEAAARNHTRIEQALWRTFTHDTIVIYKSHEFDRDLLRLCDRALVLVTHAGCVERAARSVVAAQFIPLDRHALAGHLRLVFDDLFAWRQHAALDMSNDDLLHHPLRCLALIYHAVAAALGAPYETRDFSRYAAELRAEGNAAIPHRELEAAQVAQLRQYLQQAKEDLAGDARLVGTRWFCDG